MNLEQEFSNKTGQRSKVAVAFRKKIAPLVQDWPGNTKNIESFQETLFQIALQGIIPEIKGSADLNTLQTAIAELEYEALVAKARSRNRDAQKYKEMAEKLQGLKAEIEESGLFSQETEQALKAMRQEIEYQEDRELHLDDI